MQRDTYKGIRSGNTIRRCGYTIPGITEREIRDELSKIDEEIDDLENKLINNWDNKKTFHYTNRISNRLIDKKTHHLDRGSYSFYSGRKKTPAQYCERCDGRNCRGFSPPRRGKTTNKSKSKWKGCKKQSRKDQDNRDIVL